MLTVSSRWICIFWKGSAEAVAIDRTGVMRSQRRARTEEKEVVGEEERNALLSNRAAVAILESDGLFEWYFFVYLFFFVT
jgi:hypothetical protein